MIKKTIVNMILVSALFCGSVVFGACCRDTTKVVGRRCYKIEYCEGRRLDNKCNSDRGCCPGFKCGPFGTCEECG